MGGGCGRREMWARRTLWPHYVKAEMIARAKLDIFLQPSEAGTLTENYRRATRVAGRGAMTDERRRNGTEMGPQRRERVETETPKLWRRPRRVKRTSSRQAASHGLPL